MRDDIKKDASIYSVEAQVQFAGFRKLSKPYDLNNNSEQFAITIEDSKIQSVEKIVQKPKGGSAWRKLFCCCGRKSQDDAGDDKVSPFAIIGQSIHLFVCVV